MWESTKETASFRIKLSCPPPPLPPSPLHMSHLSVGEIESSHLLIVLNALNVIRKREVLYTDSFKSFSTVFSVATRCLRHG